MNDILNEGGRTEGRKEEMKFKKGGKEDSTVGKKGE